VKFDFLTVLRSSNFRIFTAAQTISQFGEKLFHIVLISLVGAYAEGSPSVLAKVAIAFTLPAIVCAPFVGTLVDRWNRRTILIASDGLRFALIALLPFVILQRGTLSLLYPFVFGVFLLAVFFNISKLSIIPNLVAHRGLLAANSVSLFGIRLATICGMVLGGYIVDWSIWRKAHFEGWQAGFIINAFLFLTSATLLARMALTSTPSGRSNGQYSFSDLRAAFRMALQERVVRFVMLSAFLLCLIGASIYVLVVNLVQQELAKGTTGVSWTAGILACGTLLSALVYGHVGRRLDKAPVVSACLAVVGVLLVVLSRVTSTSSLIIVSFLGGFFLAPVPIAQDTLLHERLDEKMRGRIFGIRDFGVNLFFAVGSLTLGLISSATSTRLAMFIMGSLIGTGSTILLLISIRSVYATHASA